MIPHHPGVSNDLRNRAGRVKKLPCFRPFTNLTIRLSEESLTHVIPTHRNHDVLRTFCTAFRIATTAARHPGIPQ